MYSFVTTLDRFPHACFTCGGGTDRDWYLDLGEMNDSPDVMMPTIYICNLCITAICAEKGLVDSAPLLAKIEDLETSLYHAKVKADGLETGFNGLLAARFLNPDDPAVVDLVGFLSHHQSDAGGPQGEGSNVEAGEGEPSEPVHGSDLAGIPGGLRIDGGSA